MKFNNILKKWRKLTLFSLAIFSVNNLIYAESQVTQNIIQEKPQATLTQTQDTTQIEKVTKLNALLQNILTILQNPNIEKEFNKFNNSNATKSLNNAIIVAVISKKTLGPKITKKDLELLKNINLNGKNASEIVRDIFLYVIYKALEFNNNNLSEDTALLLNSIKKIIYTKYAINFELLNNHQEIKETLLKDIAIQNILANPTIKKFIIIMQIAPILAVNFLNYVANDANVTKVINMAPEFKSPLLGMIQNISCLA